MNELERYGSPVYRETPAPRLITRRLYNALLAGFVVLSFVIMAICSHITTTIEFVYFVYRNPMLFMIGSLVCSIGGIICMSVGRSKESLPIGLVGYALFTLTFGFSTSFVMSAYSLDSITTAFTATAGIMIVFGAAGIAFPRFFAKIQGVLLVALVAIIVVELVLTFTGVSQSLTDVAVILVFCGFIGYDVYRASVAAPTVSNALWYAIELYLDIINVFLRLLSLFGRRE